MKKNRSTLLLTLTIKIFRTLCSLHIRGFKTVLTTTQLKGSTKDSILTVTIILALIKQ
jgi:hypothetical protein